LLSTTRRLTWPLALSALLHAAALGGLAALAVARLDYRPVISVSLRADHGGAPHGAEASPGRPADPRAAVIAPSRPRPQAQQRAASGSRRKLRQARALAPHAPLPAPSADDHAESGAAPDAGNSPTAGTHGGSGIGSGAGNGHGDGTDVRALCVYCPTPVYPYMARARGWEGNVDVGLELTGDGNVRDAHVRRSSGHAALDDVAVAVARRSRFAVLNAAAQSVHGRIEYCFRLTAE